jgi:DNA-binding transcriptional LysR family regulator
MNRNHLAIFRAVAEAGSISRGAEALLISQPAVSSQVAELETALGAKLFDRLPRGVRLTQAGETLFGYARRIALIEDEAARAMTDLRGLKRGRLAVGASRTIGAYLLPQLLGKFRRQHPDIELAVSIGNTREIHQQVMEHALELGLTEGVVDDPLLDARAFGSDELVTILPPQHPLTRSRKVTAAMVCREPLIFREVGSGTREVVERALARKGLAPTPAFSLGSPEAIKRAVAAGLGVAIMSRLAVADELRAGRLVTVTLADLKINRPLFVVRMKNMQPSSAGVGFEKLVGQGTS